MIISVCICALKFAPIWVWRIHVGIFLMFLIQYLYSIDFTEFKYPFQIYNIYGHSYKTYLLQWVCHIFALCLDCFILMVSAKSNIGYFRNINGSPPLCNFLLHALKPVIWTLCFVVNKGVFFSFLLNSLAAFQTFCFVCLVYFCLILTPELPESGSLI